MEAPKTSRSVIPGCHHESISEPVNAPVSASMPNHKRHHSIHSRRNDERQRPLHLIWTKLRDTRANYNHMMANRIDVIDMACEEYSQEVLGFSNVILEWHPTLTMITIRLYFSSTLTPFGTVIFSYSEEADLFLL
ncbi:hypothetical protein Tco_0414284 [Tanacetum coccineum]